MAFADAIDAVAEKPSELQPLHRALPGMRRHDFGQP
jgi:hypothetical protein